MSRSRPTQLDVARRAGVSRALVSLVVQGSSRVSPQRREAVQQAIEELGYRPQEIAAHLAARRTDTIGVVLPDLRNPFYGELAEAILEVAREAGRRVLIAVGFGDAVTDARSHPGGTAFAEAFARGVAAEQDAAGGFLAGRADSLVLVSPRSGDAEIAKLARSAPVSVIGREVALPGIGSVRTDEAAGGELAVAHLLSRGGTRLAHLGPTGSPYADVAARERQEAFLASAERRGVPARPVLLTDAAGPEQIEGMVEELVADGVDAIGVHNDRLAIGLLTTVPRRRFTAIVGYDDIPAAGQPIIGLSTIDQLPRELARHALEQLAADAPGHVRLAPQLRARAT
ncbi:LacI family DNA-binding transcriptional regulator [Brachybacterium hainanense]|uniref:LacI family DNA-binding transcriptional regulator n=1 Tax=Brachybacterium hainanense TaxID=1541174 RepID=A0ABV6R6X1_9MICO